MALLALVPRGGTPCQGRSRRVQATRAVLELHGSAAPCILAARGAAGGSSATLLMSSVALRMGDSERTGRRRSPGQKVKQPVLKRSTVLAPRGDSTPLPSRRRAPRLFSCAVLRAPRRSGAARSVQVFGGYRHPSDA